MEHGINIKCILLHLADVYTSHRKMTESSRYMHISMMHMKHNRNGTRLIFQAHSDQLILHCSCSSFFLLILFREREKQQKINIPWLIFIFSYKLSVSHKTSHSCHSLAEGDMENLVVTDLSSTRFLHFFSAWATHGDRFVFLFLQIWRHLGTDLYFLSIEDINVFLYNSFYLQSKQDWHIGPEKAATFDQ